MESNGQDYGESAGTGVMVSNLPLLFTRGFPSSLQQMKLDELEDFVPFMVRCSIGEESPVPWSQLPRPSWWPRKLPFRIPSGNTPAAKRTALISLVERCYSYHGCEYLLQFCASLVETMPSTGFRFNDNRDGTTSMYHGSTGKLLVTFRNENRDYDKSNHDLHMRKKLLLSPTRVSSSSGTTTAVFQPAATDIYLCDKCENEFYSLREVQIHEKKCCGDAPPSPVPPSPEPEPVDDEPEPAGQVPFLAYFKLQPAKHTGIEPYMSPRKRSSSPPRKLLGPMFPRFESVALTSPLGKFLLTNSKLRNKYQNTQHSVMRYERHLHATPHTDMMFGRERCTNRWIVVWRQNKEEQPWYHVYCFNKAHRKERRLAIKTGLNWKSRRLITLCRPARVMVKRLQKRVVDRVMRLNGPTAPCIDLTDEPHRMFGEFVCTEDVGQNSPDPLGLNHNGTQNIIEDPLRNTSEDPLRLFYDSSDERFNEGASSSSQSPINPALLSIPTSSSQSLDSWNGPTEERDPLAADFSPGDIIECESISLLPLPNPSLVPNSAMNHVAHHSNSRYPDISDIIAPGPKCSKIAKQAQLAKQQQLKRLHNSGGLLMSNNDLIQLSKGNFSVLNQLGNRTPPSKVKLEGHSGPKLSRGNFDQNCVEKPGNNSHQSVPQCSSNDNNRVLLNCTSNVNTSNVPPPLPSHLGAANTSLIEVIDLSSDEDDAARIRQHDELSGVSSSRLSHFNQSGATMPSSSSSKLSMPKNGNSHWSSKFESHCDAGRVGDLAINGQPLHVLKSSISPVPNSLFLSPSPSPSPAASHTTNSTRCNPLKRKHDQSPLDNNSNRKLKVLDVSSQGLKVLSQEEIVAEGNEISSVESWGKGEHNSAHLELIPIYTREFNGTQYYPSAASPTFPDSDQLGAFVNDSYSQSKNWLNSSSKDKADLIPGDHDARVLNESQEKSSSISLLNNIVNTVSKGVEYICSFIGSADTLEANFPKENLSGSIQRVSGTLNKVRVSQKNNEFEKPSQNIDEDSYHMPLRVSEVDKLLQDECRELHLKGLDEMRFVDLKSTKRTRRSVDRVIPIRGRRKPRLVRSWEKKVEDNDVSVGSEICEKIVNEDRDIFVSPLPTPPPDDGLAACIDENGNSPTFAKSKLGRGAPSDVYSHSKAKQSIHYLSQLQISNNNNNDSVSVENPVSSKSDKMFADHYRDSTDMGCDVQNSLSLDSGPVSIVNSRRSDIVRNMNISEFETGTTTIDILKGKSVVLEKNSRLKCSESHESKMALLGHNLKICSDSEIVKSYSSGHCSLQLLEAPTACVLGPNARSRQPVEKPISGSSAEVTTSMGNYINIVCSAAVPGKTAEEGGALRAKVPSSDRGSLINVKQSSCSMQNCNTMCGRANERTSIDKIGVQYSGCSAFSETSLHNDISRGSRFFKNLGTEQGDREVKGFQKTNCVTLSPLESRSQHTLPVVNDSKTHTHRLKDLTGSSRIPSNRISRRYKQISPRELSSLQNNECLERRRLNKHSNSPSRNSNSPSRHSNSTSDLKKNQNHRKKCSSDGSGDPTKDLCAAVENTKDSKMTPSHKIHSSTPSEISLKQKRKLCDISSLKLTSLGGECDEMEVNEFHPSGDIGYLGTITLQSYGSGSLGSLSKDSESLPLYNKQQSVTPEVLSNPSFTLNPTTIDEMHYGTMCVQQSSNSSISLVGIMPSDPSHYSNALLRRDDTISLSNPSEDLGIPKAADIIRVEGSNVPTGQSDPKLSLLREVSNLGKFGRKAMQKNGCHLSESSHSSTLKTKNSNDDPKNDSESEGEETTNIVNPKILQHQKYHIATYEDDAKDDNCNIKVYDKRKSCLSTQLFYSSKKTNAWKESQKESQNIEYHSNSHDDVEGTQGYNNSTTKQKEKDSHWMKGGRPQLLNTSPRTNTDSVDECKKQRKKSSIPRELRNLGKDEWKEMKNTGFHPSDFVGSQTDELTYFLGGSDDEESVDSVENKPPSAPKLSQSSQQKESKKLAKKLPRELAGLLKDECKELKQKKGILSGASSKVGRSVLNRYKVTRNEERVLNKEMLSNQLENSLKRSIDMLDEFRSSADSNRGANGRSTRSQTNVVSLVEVMTPRDSHRQLLRSETGMCVLNFELPLIS